MPKQQLHKRFTTDQVRIILQWYCDGILPQKDARDRLEVSERRFFELLSSFRSDPGHFQIEYPKRTAHNKITDTEEYIIREELEKDRSLIDNPQMPVKFYNYRAVRDEVVKRLGKNISDQTIRNRAHAWGFATEKPKTKPHDRIVLTSAVGQLFQHDSSSHQWSPLTFNKWSLITTLDDYSRKLLFADFFEQETTWNHIEAVESVVLQYGTGLAYYVDNHSIFRFVCYQDSRWYQQIKGTDDVLTAWKTVVVKCGMQVWYAMSPQAKGKIERPYRWLQDRIVRRCAKEGVTTISDGKMILKEEVERYNHYQVHSTTKEIPDVRFERALQEGKSLLKPFTLPDPYKSIKDIFCLTVFRKVDGYRQVSWKRYIIKVPQVVPVGAEVILHILPTDQPEIRVWFQNNLIVVVRLQLP